MTSKAKTKPSRPRGKTGTTTTDDFLGGRLTVLQPKTGHRAGSDAVFLAAAVGAQAGDSVLDACAGVGVAGLCLLARVPKTTVTAVEIDERQCALAAENAARNGLPDRFAAIRADVTAPAKDLAAAGLIREGYDQVMANPPFYMEGAVRAAPNASRAAAHVMPRGELGRWVRFLTTMAAPKGALTVIHRADCLGALLDLLQDRFGDLAVFPLFPKAAEPAVRVIVQGRKGSRAGLRLLSGLVLHGPDGAYTGHAEAVLRGGEALRLGAPRKKGRRPGGKGGSPNLPEREESSRARKVR
ncbi:MAG: tRNA1(Val) (adenine(37)-N6)-methyltransferase [Methyloceanibacter sp.]|uniref:tRNA1(Val) (adenine(37)-N6)-methyltransferase n=1 Tax=Methyloceanibacter sp. TaxID=1965321 RepID=UPI003EE31368